jgi:diaminobutyrate acetyltransferase
MDGKLVGFISGYLPPKAPDVLFIWQVAVAAEARGRGLGKSMLRELLARDACAGVQALETTITPSNQASFGLFKAMARECGAETRTETLFTEEQLGSGHEEEVLVRIAPLHRTFQGDAHG